MSNNATSAIDLQALEEGRASGIPKNMSNNATSAINVPALEEGQASGIQQHQFLEDGEKVHIVVQEKSIATSPSLRERLSSLELESELESNIPKIQKVPFMLRDNQEFKKYYEPRVVALGPIHHRNSKFEYSKYVKRKLAGQFIKENDIEKENLYNQIMTRKLEDLKNCYVEDVIKDYNDDDLCWMFMVDGCAILHFIHCLVQNPEKLENLKVKKDQIAFAQQDFFLLENQLPYQLLEFLLSFVHENDKKTKIEESIEKFICRNLMTTDPTHEITSKTAHHLLDLLRQELLLGKPEQPEEPECRYAHSFRNVKDLTASGIRLKPNYKRCLDIGFDISFGLIGTLTLPSLVVDDSTAPKFLNLIAYEMCPTFMNNFNVTSYICFLDSLIDHPEDVEKLRKANILINLLGSDKEVAKLFNKIGTDLVPNPNLYGVVKDKIETYYNNSWTTCLAEGSHTYFSSPWTIFALLGALLGLFFSAVQAYFSLPGNSN